MAGSLKRGSYDTLMLHRFSDTPPELPPPRVKTKRPQMKAPIPPPMKDLPPIPPPFKDNHLASVYRPEEQEENLSLTDFVTKHADTLPRRVVVKEGFCGSDERTIISTGDVYNFHFIKKEKMMSIQDAGGTRISLPINSAVQFGIVYNPAGDMKQAIKGYSFKTIGELADYPHPPRIVKSTKRFSSSDKKSSVESNEILVIKSIGRTGVSRKQCVKVHSMLTRSDKTLYSDCEGCFVTDPGSIRLFLTDINEFFYDQLPQKAIVYLNSDVTNESITNLDSEVITLTHVSVESSIIATNWNEGEDDVDDIYECECPISIPIYLDIAVELLEEDDDYENLYDNTMELFDNFNPSKIKEISGGAKLPMVVSADMRKSNKEGYQFGGLEIQRPSIKTFGRGPPIDEENYESLYDMMPSDHDVQSSVITNKEKVPHVKDHAPVNPSPQSSPWLSRKKVLPPPVKQRKDQDRTNQQAVKLPVEARKSSLPNLPEKEAPGDVHKAGNLEELQKTVARLSETVANLTRRVDQLQDEMKELKQTPPAGQRNCNKENSSVSDSNIKSLRNLSHPEILQLLDNLNLSQHKEMFQHEQIDGDMLADCDDMLLLHEMRMENKLHRMKLLKVITGKYSALNILEGKDPYVVFKHHY